MPKTFVLVRECWPRKFSERILAASSSPSPSSCERIHLNSRWLPRKAGEEEEGDGIGAAEAGRQWKWAQRRNESRVFPFVSTTTASAVALKHCPHLWLLILPSLLVPLPSPVPLGSFSAIITTSFTVFMATLTSPLLLFLGFFFSVCLVCLHPCDYKVHDE